MLNLLTYKSILLQKWFDKWITWIHFIKLITVSYKVPIPQKYINTSLASFSRGTKLHGYYVIASKFTFKNQYQWASLVVRMRTNHSMVFSPLRLQLGYSSSAPLLHLWALKQESAASTCTSRFPCLADTDLIWTKNLKLY